MKPVILLVMAVLLLAGGAAAQRVSVGAGSASALPANPPPAAAAAAPAAAIAAPVKGAGEHSSCYVQIDASRFGLCNICSSQSAGLGSPTASVRASVWRARAMGFQEGRVHAHWRLIIVFSLGLEPVTQLRRRWPQPQRP